jgi:hypothetical protein
LSTFLILIFFEIPGSKAKKKKKIQYDVTTPLFQTASQQRKQLVWVPQKLQPLDFKE